MCGPSSGCDLTYRGAIQDVWGVFEGIEGWGRGLNCNLKMAHT